jgi:hypothetical protein
VCVCVCVCLSVCLCECKNRTGHVSPSASLEHYFVVVKIPYVAAMVPAHQLNTTRLTLDVPTPQCPPRTSEDLREPLLIPAHIREPPRTSENVLNTSEDLRGRSRNLRGRPRTTEQPPRRSEKFRALSTTATTVWGSTEPHLLAIIWYVGPSHGCPNCLSCLCSYIVPTSTVTQQQQAHVTKHCSNQLLGHHPNTLAHITLDFFYPAWAGMGALSLVSGVFALI